MDSSEEQGSPGGKAEEVEESPTGFDEYVEVEDEKPPSNGSLRQKNARVPGTPGETLPTECARESARGRAKHTRTPE